ncbi:putative integral membrane protein [Besnoitia besnoiti]|uniref:Putative integral membrane protein n=1 Tax=Besnoitia besnoiti TaxID=94643 RepID=A0A2A9MEM6_BESBE|nr:putative integral membrane protein [Besnoitia besnoiti]PFH34087.1 putative integral membrane protein [Besnoitia besnoiti]
MPVDQAAFSAAGGDGGAPAPFLSVDPSNTLLIFSLGVAVGLFSEILSYFFIYRHEEFYRLQEECKKLYRELDALEVVCGSDATGKRSGRGSKAAEQVEKKIQRKTKQMASYRQKGNLMVGLLLMVSMPLVYASFDERPAAYLPFQPIFPFSMVLRYSAPAAPGGAAAAATESPAGLPAGTSLCAAAGFFMLTMMSTRMSLQKMFGYGTRRGVAKM